MRRRKNKGRDLAGNSRAVNIHLLPKFVTSFKCGEPTEQLPRFGPDVTTTRGSLAASYRAVNNSSRSAQHVMLAAERQTDSNRVAVTGSMQTGGSIPIPISFEGLHILRRQARDYVVRLVSIVDILIKTFMEKRERDVWWVERWWCRKRKEMRFLAQLVANVNILSDWLDQMIRCNHLIIKDGDTGDVRCIGKLCRAQKVHLEIGFLFFSWGLDRLLPYQWILDPGERFTIKDAIGKIVICIPGAVSV